MNQTEQRSLASATSDVRHTLAVRLGLHGLRADEILGVRADHVHPHNGHDSLAWLTIEDPKGGDHRQRDVPIRRDLARSVELHALDGLDVESMESVRRWVRGAAATVAADDEADGREWLTPHDLRRSYATTLYYELATSGVPAAESLAMGWGGWRQTEAGRATFRENYLGPVPGGVAADALDAAGWV